MVSGVLGEVLGVGALDRAVLGAKSMLGLGHTMENQLRVRTTQGTPTDGYNPE